MDSMMIKLMENVWNVHLIIVTVNKLINVMNVQVVIFNSENCLLVSVKLHIIKIIKEFVNNVMLLAWPVIKKKNCLICASGFVNLGKNLGCGCEGRFYLDFDNT